MNLLFDDYHYSIIDETEFFEIFSENRKNVFEDVLNFQVYQLVSEEEMIKIKNLKKNLDGNFRLYMKVTKAEKLIGWFFGNQLDNETFTMVNTGILKEYRNQGVYSHLLKKVLEIVEKEGFQKVESQHHTSNNQVIVPKLKAGFIITGLEIEDKVGMKVRLTYYFNEKRRKILEFRIGHKKLDRDFEKFMDLWEK